MTFYTQKLKAIKMDMYLSGSIDGYERTHGLCWNDTVENS